MTNNYKPFLKWAGGKTNIIDSIVKHIPEKMLGRIFAIISISILSMTAVSSGMIGVMAEFFAIKTIFLIFGILAGACGIAGLIHPKIKYLN